MDKNADWEEHALGRAYTWTHGTFKIVSARTSTTKTEGCRTKSRVFKIQYAESESYGTLPVSRHRTLVKAGNIEPAPAETVSHLDD